MFGYAGKILRVDLSSESISELPTINYADRFLGGRGVAAALYWDEVPPEANAFDAENALIFATGPLAGVPVFGGSRWLVYGKSPATFPEHSCSCNLGGDWGLRLKSAGYDAVLIRGESEKPVYLFLHDGVSELKDASVLWGRGAIETRKILKGELGSSASVVAIGPAGENMVSIATLVADNDAVGSGGMGAVMGSKKLKAIAVRSARQRMEVARPEKVKELAAYFRSLGREPIPAAGNLVFRITGPGTEKAPCYGCLGTCHRRTYQADDGQKGKFMCQAATFYQALSEPYYGPGHEIPFHATKLCDDYGLDTMSLSMIILWLQRCHRAGILTDENSGIPISKMGSLEFIETLARKISLRDGFGDLLAQGIAKAADGVGPGARELITKYISKAGQPNINEPRLYVTTALLYAMEPKPPMPQLQEVSRVVLKWLEWINNPESGYASSDVVRRIARRFWGSAAAADFSTFDGKALAARMIQDREYAKDCLVLCSFFWPVMDIEHSQDHVGDPTLETLILSAVTGKDIAEKELYLIGERVFNLQRAILVREGHHGREGDHLPETWHTTPLKGDMANPECLVPGKGDKSISRKGAVIDRQEFERSRDEYYQIRQWDVATGLQTRAKLEELDLADVARDLEQRGLISG